MNTLRSTNAQRAGARLLAVLLLAVVLLAAGCATPPPPAPPTPVPLLHDKLFPGAVRPPAADDLFTLSAEMEAYANRHLLSLLRQSDPRQALVDTMYLKGGLQLSYDASRTRTAAEAFAARQGNCLSLVIMTAAFAQWLGLPVSFQSVLVEETYSRNGDLTLASQHVNLVIGPPPLRPGVGRGTEDTLVVDFLPAADIRGQRGRPLERRTIVAMFFNNRAAEALVDGQLDQAYWLAREALLHDPGYVNAANTLGVIYARAGHDGAAEAALRHVLASDATAINALSNLLPLLQRTQRGGEAAAVAARLAALQPVAPFRRLEEGRQAMAARDYERARSLFQEELRLQPFQDEVHFWAAQAAWHLGREAEAARHLTRAREYSVTRDNQARYSAKLEALRAAPRLQ